MDFLPFTEAHQIGLQVLSSGGLEELRVWFTLSHTKMANHLCTNTTTLRSWMSDPAAVTRMQDTTVARVGQFAYQLSAKARELYDNNVRITDLYPLSLLAGELGRSVSSPRFREWCQQERLTCYDTGILGIYVPKDQADQLKSKVVPSAG
jgi:hypothetical protein